jgi:serine/threonine protein kinase
VTGHLREGETLGDYEILSVAGIGGMGVVYKARQRSLGRVVALKVIREEIASTPEYRDRFLREARLAASIDHPHVVSVYDVRERDDRLFLAMQWIEGEDLKRVILQSGPLEADRAVVIAEQLAGALDALHASGLIHRDVKPANVLLRLVAGKDHAYLTDFGVAKPVDTVERLTKTGWVVGTAGYLAPEQIMGQEPGPRSDLYALGCLAFEALTGQAPFRGTNEMALRWAHANDPRPQPSRVHPRLGPRYDDFFARALAVDPEQRFGSGREFAEALHTAQDHEGEIATRAIPLQPRVPTAIGPPTPLPPPNAPPPGPGFYPPYGYVTPPAGYAQQPRSGNPLALVVLGLVAVAGIAVGGLAAAGVFSHAAQTSPAVTGPTPSTPGNTTTSSTTPTTSSGQSSTPVPQHPLTASTTSFNGNAFSISYPASWQVKSAEQPHSYGTDTTLVSPTNSDTLLRVDVQANTSTTDPMAAATPVINALRTVPGYQQVDLSRGTFQGFPAVHWEFIVPESGVTLHKEDEFFYDSNNSSSVAILTQAPASQYGRLASDFSTLRQSVVMH